MAAMVRTYVRVGWRDAPVELGPGVIEALFAQLRDPAVVPREDPQGEGFLIVDRVDVDQFLQILGPGPIPERPAYRVEYKDADGRMYVTEAEGDEVVERVLLWYADDRDGWHDLLDWRRFRL